MAALSAIEIAKQRLLLVKQKIQQEKDQQEAALLANKTLAVPSLTQNGLQYDTSRDWNAEQMQAINAGLAGKSFCLIGAAGTGKTSVEKGIVYSLLKNNMLPTIKAGRSTKWLYAGVPGVVLVSFTNMAVRQIAKHFSNDITCITIHKLLEYEPHYYVVTNDKGEDVNKMEFRPSRNRMNPLPSELKTIIVDESSMVDCDLFDKLIEALPHPEAVQFIFLGDLNQLPPVYGGPILGKKLLELPVIELVQVYRQALESPIIRYALMMKDGKSITATTKVVEDNGEHGRVVIQPWSMRMTWQDALIKASNFLKGAFKEQIYDPLQDMFLCPYNVNFGTIELNAQLADYLGRERQAMVWEVVAGFNTHYYAVGDKVLVNKREAFIQRIVLNGGYTGKRPIDPHLYDIDRWGGAKKRKTVNEKQLADDLAAASNEFDVDAFLDGLKTTEITDRKNQASHRITVAFLDTHDRTSFDLNDPELETAELTTASEINEMLFGYVCTVHKSQGSEWRRVFFITHHSHSKMTSRELCYTAMTRAKEYLHIICEPDRGHIPGTLAAAAKKPRLKGNTLAEKLVSLKERFDKEAKEKATQRKEEDDDE